MIDEFVLENCGPIEQVRWRASPHINLIIGKNGTGKSILMKMLYVVLRSTEEYQRGNNRETFRQIIGEKLRGTFQVEQVGDLVRKGADRLKVECKLDKQQIHFSFSPSAVRGVGDVTDIVQPRSTLSIFLPPKEILSLTGIIKRRLAFDLCCSLGKSRKYTGKTIAHVVENSGHIPAENATHPHR
ncbi:MAG: hypothetical protein KDE19_24715 [Caldilineaceae bacterium]|nr:hypothetical protein [Caldilineaceae bacterium]